MRTTKEAADYLGISPRRVVALIQSGFLEAEKAGGIWLVDDASLELRAHEGQRHVGRPRIGSKPAETSYLLKNRTYDLARVVYDSSRKEFTSVGPLVDVDRAPLGLMNSRKRISVASFNTWWRNRGIPEGRPALTAMLAEENSAIPFELAVRGLGLSLSDQYWICPEGSGLRWEELNYFDNGFGNAPGAFREEAILKNPDNTSDGVLPKHWVIENGKRRLLKGGGPLMQEPYNEVVATSLYRRLIGDTGFVPYTIDHIEGLPVSSCPEFLTDKEEFVAADYVVRTRTQAAHHNEYQHYLECCYALGVEGIERQVAYMVVGDDILANADRHYRNFGIIRNVETLQCRPAPIFDSGTSLWCKKTLAELKRGDFTFTSRPFNPEPSRQLSLIPDLSWIDVEALEGFVPEAVGILSENSLLAERMPFIEEGLQHRVDRICAIRGYL